MADANLNLNVTVTAQIEAALAKIRELAMAARTDTSAPTNQRAKAISDEIALTRALRNEEEKLMKGAQPGRAPERGSEAGKARAAANAEIRSLRQQRLGGVDQSVVDEVMRMVGTPAKQTRYAARELGFAAAAGPVSTVSPAIQRKINEESKSAKAETARLNAARQDEAFTKTLLGLDVETKRFWATMERLRSQSGSYAEAMVAGTVAQRKLTADITAAASAERSYIESTALLANTRKRLQQETVLETAGIKTEGLTPQQIQDKAAGVTRRMRITDTTRQISGAAADPAEVKERANLRAANANLAAQVRQESLVTAGYVQDKAKVRVAFQQEDIAIKEEIRSRILAGVEGGEGTRYQRLTALASPTTRLPQEMATGGQSLITKGLSSAQYMVSGMATGALIFGIVDAVKEATKLQKALAGLKGQMEALGRGGDFGSMRDGIKAISNETGVASTEVTRFASRLAGLFNDPVRALDETSSAMRLAVVSGTDMNTLLEELVPTARAFNISIEQIGDAAVTLHDKYGIAEEDILQFFGATSAAAKAAGFTFEQLGPIGAAAANSVGVSLNVAGEQFNKAIETIRNNADKVYGVFQRRPDTAALGAPIIEALGRGEGGEAFKLLLASYSKLDAAQQQNLIRVSGSRREWALLSGLFSRSDEVLGNIIESEQGVGDQTGALDRRFKEISATILQTNERVRDLIRNLVEGLVSSGIGGALNFILQSFEKLLSVGSLLMKVFDGLNNKLKFGPFDEGLLAFLTQIAAGIFLASRAWAAYSAVKAAQARVNAVITATEERLGVSVAATTAAEGAETTVVNTNTAAKQANTIVTTNLAGETVLLTTTTGVATGAEEVNTTVVAANTGVKEANMVVTANMAGQTVITGGTTAAREALATGTGTFAGSTAGNIAGTTAAAAGGGVFATVGKNLFGPIINIAKGIIGKIPGIGGAIGASGAGAASASSLGATATSVPGIGAMLAGGIVASNWARDQAREGGVALKLPGTDIALTPGAMNLTQQEADLKAQLKTMRDEDVMAMAEDSRSAWGRGVDRIQEAFFDVDLPVTAAMKEAALRTGAQGRRTATGLGRTGKIKEFAQKINEGNLKNLDDFVKQGGPATEWAEEHGLTGAGGDPAVNRENLEKALPGILQAAEAGDAGANEFLAGVDRIVGTQETLADVRKALDLAMAKDDAAGKKAKEAVDSAGGMDAFLNKQYDPKGAMDIGQISPAEFLAQINQDIETKKLLLATSQEPEADYKALNAKIREGEQFRDQYIRRRIDSLNKTSDAESSTPKADALAREIEALPTLSPTERLNSLTRLQDLARAKFEEQLAAIQDPIERYRVATEGVAVDPAIQQLDLIDQIRNLTPPAALAELAKTPEAREKLMTEVAEESVRTGVAVKEILLRKLEERRKIMEWLPGVDLSGIDAVINALKASPDITTDSTLTEDPKIAERKKIDDVLKQTESEISLAKSGSGAQGRRRQAQLNLQQAQAKLDAVTRQAAIGGANAPTKADINNAQSAVNDALRLSDEVTTDTALAMMEWDVINAYGDPLKQSTIRLKIANQKAAIVLRKVGGDTKDPEYIKAQQEARQQEIAIINGEHENALALMDWAEINAGGPREAAVARLDKARLALEFAIQDAQGNMSATPVIRAAQEVRRAELALLESEGDEATNRYAVLLATHERDPLEVARLNQQAAVEALERARGTAGEQQALADKIRADHAFEDAISDIFASRANLAIALAEVAGNPVKAAQIAVTEAKRKLDEAKAQNRGEAEINQLTGEFATASENAARQGRSEEESIIDFQLQMRQITTQQAIEGLKLILSRTKAGTDEYRSLVMKIDSLEQQAGGDLQFNLPANIALPTLYEARRVNQGSAAGIGYQDNRNVVLSFQVNGAQDPALVAAEIMNAMGSAMGGGQLYTPGVSTGAFN